MIVYVGVNIKSNFYWLSVCPLLLQASQRVTSESMSEWGSRHAHLNEVSQFLMECTDPQTSRALAEERRKLNKHWAEFVERTNLVSFLPNKMWDLDMF